MPGLGERSYAYAKACGIIGKSFTGKRLKKLEAAGRLSELDKTVFPESWRDLPEKELLLDLEKRITNRSVASIISIVRCFSKPPEFLTLLVRGYEYVDLKNILSAAMEEEKNIPPYTDLGSFQTIRFDAWPDVPAMLKGTEFEFILDKKNSSLQGQDEIFIQTALDKQYYSALWKSLLSLPHKDRHAAVKILSEEISLRNSSWALRLRTYYHLTAEYIKSHLIIIPEKGKVDTKTSPRSLADDAIRCLDYPLDTLSAWSSWRWKGFLNPDPGGRPWRANPRYFQNAASLYLYRLAKRCFRLKPFSLDTIFCFIKIKQFEEDLLTSSAEGLGMGMSSGEIFSMLGVDS